MIRPCPLLLLQRISSIPKEDLPPAARDRQIDSLTKDAVQDGAFDYYSDSRPEPDRIKIETINSGSDEGNLLMFRDSFGNALISFFGGYLFLLRLFEAGALSDGLAFRGGF